MERGHGYGHAAAAAAGVVFLYLAAYGCLRAGHVIVHVASVLVRDRHGYTHAIVSDRRWLGRLFWPARWAETAAWNWRLVGELDDACE